MKARILVMSVLLGMLVGCTDTADSISREYRNEINESLDAMMLVTDEVSAQQMTLRVFKPMADRFKEVDRRLGILRMNRTKKEFAAEFTTSDSANMYISEIFINRERFKEEMKRLKSVKQREIEAKQQAHAKSGSEEPFNPTEACKALNMICAESGALSSLDSQLNKTPAMFALINEMNAWKLDQAVLDEMNSRRKKFNIPLGELK
jgi:hypothetical protein